GVSEVPGGARDRRQSAGHRTASKSELRGREMTPATANHLDLTPPPVVKTIARRSLMVGVVFGVVALIGAFMRPEEFYRAYLLGFMCWLGVALGSMAFLMIRHL